METRPYDICENITDPFSTTDLLGKALIWEGGEKNKQQVNSAVIKQAGDNKMQSAEDRGGRKKNAT